MKKLFLKDEVLFAVLWIVVYVLLFSAADGASEALGVPKLLTVAAGIVLAALLLGFVRKNRLGDYLGLCGLKCSAGKLIYFLPLIVISTMNLWAGIAMPESAIEPALGVAAMCFVGLLEEIIFRGLLFKGMCKGNVKTAVIVSSLTFGVGHAVNLLLGAPLLSTLLQLVYAAAVGFCYTAIFLACGSLLPCILSHALVNSLSVFTVQPDVGTEVAIALVVTVIALGYGALLLRKTNKPLG